MQSAHILPDRERLSSVMAVILLAYAAARFVQLPVRTLNFEFAGIFLPLELNVNTIASILVAGLTASGADWLLREHPAFGGRSAIRHWVLPAMTAWVLSLPLANLPLGISWWLAFVGTGFLLFAILVAEFNSVSADSRLHSLAISALTALAYGLFLILAISVRGVALRLYLALPAVAAGVFMVSTRVHLLRGTLVWQPLQSVAITFVVIQIAAALHYLPISALGYGLALLGLIYGLNQFAAGLNSGLEIRQAGREGLIPLAVFWALALLVR